LHRAELTVCCCLIRFSWHGASCPREIWRFSTVSSPEVQKRRGADVDLQAAWAHVSNQEHQVSPRGASDWWRESVGKSVSVHQDKIRGSAMELTVCCRLIRFSGDGAICPRGIFRFLLSPSQKCREKKELWRFTIESSLHLSKMERRYGLLKKLHPQVAWIDPPARTLKRGARCTVRQRHLSPVPVSQPP